MVDPACDRSACGDFRRGRCDNPDCPAISYAFGSEHQLYLQCKHDLESANDAMREIFPRAHTLAHVLECLLMDTKDMATVSKWWDSAHEAIEQWREFCREDDKKTPNARLTG